MSINEITDRKEPHPASCGCEYCEAIAEVKCEFCEGEGRIENYTTTKDDSTGYNEVVEGTGTYRPCFNCNQE